MFVGSVSGGAGVDSIVAVVAAELSASEVAAIGCWAARGDGTTEDDTWACALDLEQVVTPGAVGAEGV